VSDPVLNQHDSWRKVRLTEVAELNPRRFSDSITDHTLVSFIPMKAVEEESGRLDPSSTKPWAAVKKGYTPFQNDDVIFAKITPCMENGKYAIARGLHGGRAAGSTEFHVFRPSKSLDPQFLLYFLFSPEVRRGARLNMRGAAGQLRVPPLFFETLELPLPSIDEQRRIVAEIEKQFTRLEAGVAGLRRVQTNLKRYRAAVLKAACEGKLVPTEAELARQEARTYETGAQLLERILTERPQKWSGKGKYKEPIIPDGANLPELPEGWTWATADQFTSVITDGEHITPQRTNTGILLLSARNVLDGRISIDDVDFVPQHEYERIAKRLVIYPGDVLLSCSGTVGRSAVAPEGLTFTLVRSVAVLKPLAGMGKYLSIALRSPFLRNQIVQKQTQTAQANIFQGKIKTLIVPLSPLAEQQRIVAEVDSRLSVVEELEAVVTANLQRASRLRQSILQRAFCGQTSTDIGSSDPPR
jgi:type I restriction enzyme S subunit